MDSRTAWRVRRVVLGWCVGGGAILERRAGELSQRALYRRQRAAMVRRIMRLGSQHCGCIALMARSCTQSVPGKVVSSTRLVASHGGL